MSQQASTPLISVIIPTYNSQQTIQETINSVLNQTFTNFELIIIDDGSTDSTLNILSKIKEPRLKVYPYPNSGVGGPPVARNRGIAHAAGQYIAFLDHDDLWTPDKLETQLHALQANPQAAVAYSWLDNINEAGDFYYSGNRVAISGDVYGPLLVRNFLKTGSNPLICRYAFDKLGGFDETLSPADDWDMWLRLAARYHFVCVPSVQILYRIVVKSLSSDVQQTESTALRIIEREFAQAPESLQPLRKQSLAELYEHLSLRALKGWPTREKSLLATRYLWRAVRKNPKILVQKKWLILRALLKMVITILLPSRIGAPLLTMRRNSAKHFIRLRAAS